MESQRLRAANRALASGYYGVSAGALSMKLDIVTNDDPGLWKMRVQELVSRMETVRDARVVKYPMYTPPFPIRTMRATAEQTLMSSA